MKPGDVVTANETNQHYDLAIFDPITGMPLDRLMAGETALALCVEVSRVTAMTARGTVGVLWRGYLRELGGNP